MTTETELDLNFDRREIEKIDRIIDEGVRKALKTLRGDPTACVKVGHMTALFAATLAQEGGLSLEDWRSWCDEVEVIVTRKLDSQYAKGARFPLRCPWPVGSQNA